MLDFVLAVLVWIASLIGGVTPIDATYTAYTCEPVTENPMYPCNELRDGNIWEAGMACPTDWRGLYVYVPGRGIFKCDDSPARHKINDHWHVDERVPTLAEAYHVGIGVRRIYLFQWRTYD